MSIAPDDRAVLLNAIAPRIETVVARTVARTKAALAVYADVPDEELSDGIVADLQRAMAALLEERELTDADRAGMGEIGDARARAGIPLEAMLQVYRFTIDEIFNGLWEATEEGAVGHEQVVHITRMIWRYADPMMDLAISAYRRREREQVLAEGQGRTALVHRLLLEPGGSESAIAAGVTLVDPTADYVAFRARPSADPHALLLEFATPGVLDGGAAAPHDGDVIGFARARPTISPPGAVAIGLGPAGPLRDLPQSLAVATRALETAAAFGRPGMHAIDDLALEAIARTETTISEHLQRRLVTPCSPGTAAGDELLDTIRALLLHDLGVETTAAALFVHPNTVRNRLRRFEQLTGASLRSVDDLCALRIALLSTAMH